MATILTVCTGQVPATVINHFLVKTLQGSPYAFDLFSILQTPNQTDVDRKGTKPGIQDFANGFGNKTEDEVRHLINEWIEKNGRPGGISNHWITVLDNTSIEDSTLVMFYAMKKSYWDETHKSDVWIPGHARVCDDGYIWWKWRVPFRFGFYFWNLISSWGMDVLELYCRPEYLRADGSGCGIAVKCQILNRDIEDPMGRM